VGLCVWWWVFGLVVECGGCGGCSGVLGMRCECGV
jgi:hypothetical protein